MDKCANQAYKTALKLFDKDTANFVAIDGTEYSKMLFDMIVFYAGAFSYENTISFSSKDEEEQNTSIISEQIPRSMKRYF